MCQPMIIPDMRCAEKTEVIAMCKGDILIKFFKAGYGDCFLVTFNGDVHQVNFLIDGGPQKHFKSENLYSEIIETFEQEGTRNYIFVTHIDNDHITGLKYLFENYPHTANRVNGVIFNAVDDLQRFIPGAVDTPPIFEIQDNPDSNTNTSTPSGQKLE